MTCSVAGSLDVLPPRSAPLFQIYSPPEVSPLILIGLDFGKRARRCTGQEAVEVEVVLGISVLYSHLGGGRLFSCFGIWLRRFLTNTYTKLMQSIQASPATLASEANVNMQINKQRDYW